MSKEKETEEKLREEIKWLDDLIYRALLSRKEVKLFLCKDEQEGFGIKINKKVVARNLAWECFEEELEK